jgi:hypothetical protein
MPEARPDVRPFLFDLPADSLGNEIVALQYRMPQAAYREMHKRLALAPTKSIPLDGLETILAWAAPEVDLYGVDRPANAADKTLVLSVFEPPADDEDLKNRIRSAIDYWLALCFEPEVADAIGRLLDDKRASRASWQTIRIPVGPLDKLGEESRALLIYDAVAYRAAQLLRQPADAGDSGIWIPAGARRDFVHGKEVLTSVPKPEPRGYWTYVVKATTVTSPEAKGLRVALHVGVRNWGKVVKRSATRRSFDMLAPADAAISDGTTMRWVNASLRIRWTSAGDDHRATKKLLVASADRRRQAMAFVAERAGVLSLFDRFDGTPIVEGSFMLLPRLGAYHGDRWLPGGTGVGIPEREAFFETCESRLARGGFRALPPLVSTRMPRAPWQRPFKKVSPLIPAEADARDTVLIRQAIRRALGESDTLDLWTFWQRSATGDAVRKALIGLLGKPVEATSERLRWEELTVSLRQAPAEALSRPVVLNVTDPPKDLPDDKQRAVRNAARKDALRRFEGDLAGYVSKTIGKLTVPTVAILEMHESLRGEDDDPYIPAYRAFARHGVGVQCVLWSEGDRSPDADGDHTDEPDENKVERAKMGSALLDLIRMLGVCPAAPAERRPADGVPAMQAWWMVTRNEADGFDGGFRTPIAVDCADSQMRVALLCQDGNLEWVSYLEAVCRLTLRQAFPVTKDTPAATISNFFAAVAQQSTGRTIFCEASNIRRSLPGLSNSQLRPGELLLGGRGVSATYSLIDGGDKSVVRLNLDRDATPSHWARHVAQGNTAGIFPEPNTSRTFWVARPMALAMQMDRKLHRANKAGRLASMGADVKLSMADRRLPSLTEMYCAVAAFDRPPLTAAVFTRWCLGTHVTTRDETRLPFPLHEAQLLEDHVT